MAKKRRKASKKTGKKRTRRAKAARKRSNTIPLPILERRLSKLSRVVRSRGGRAA